MESYRAGGLHVVRSGPPQGTAPAGPPLLLVHGATHGAWCWELWQEKLPELGWETHALSLRNHPDSYPVVEETFRTTLKVADYADDVAAVANQLAAPCVVVGHSMGAWWPRASWPKASWPKASGTSGGTRHLR